MRQAKIVYTIEPVTDSSEQVRTLVDTGMSVVHVSRSHDKPEGHEAVTQKVRKAAATSDWAVVVLANPQGPKIHLKTPEEGPQAFEAGDTLTITTCTVPGTKELVGTAFKGPPDGCAPGDRLLTNDDNVTARAVEVTGTDIMTRVEVPGITSDHKDFNPPGVVVSVPIFSEKDKGDPRWDLKQNTNFVVFFFVRSVRDTNDIHAIVDEVSRRIPVIARIEKPQVVKALPKIVDAFDGIMVARGGFGVEVSLGSVPLVQKRVIELARRTAKPVTIATQVMDLVIKNPRPARVEASDRANAILDGANAVIFSGETSVGTFPTEAVRTMARIIESTEESGGEIIAGLSGYYDNDYAAVTCRAAASTTECPDSRYFVTFTQSGTSARKISRLCRLIPMFAFTPLESTRRRLALTWGTQTYRVPGARHTNDTVQQVDQVIQFSNLAEIGDELIIIAGMPPGTEGSSNLLRVHEMDDEANHTIGGAVNNWSSSTLWDTSGPYWRFRRIFTGIYFI